MGHYELDCCLAMQQVFVYGLMRVKMLHLQGLINGKKCGESVEICGKQNGNLLKFLTNPGNPWIFLCGAKEPFRICCKIAETGSSSNSPQEKANSPAEK